MRMRPSALNGIVTTPMTRDCASFPSFATYCAAPDDLDAHVERVDDLLNLVVVARLDVRPLGRGCLFLRLRLLVTRQRFAYNGFHSVIPSRNVLTGGRIVLRLFKSSHTSVGQ